MADTAPTYDLTLLLSLEASDEQRAKVLSEIERSIGAAGGAVVNNADWGRRPTAFQINHQAEAEYHLLQFNAPPQIIEELSHTLRITDGVMRFRVIKLRPGTPAAPTSPPPVVATAPPSAGGSGPAASATPAPPAAEPPAAAEPDGPAEPVAAEPAASPDPEAAVTAEEDTGGEAAAPAAGGETPDAGATPADE